MPGLADESGRSAAMFKSTRLSGKLGQQGSCKVSFKRSEGIAGATVKVTADDVPAATYRGMMLLEKDGIGDID